MRELEATFGINEGDLIRHVPARGYTVYPYLLCKEGSSDAFQCQLCEVWVCKSCIIADGDKEKREKGER